MAYDTIEPFGESRADLRMGIATANIINAVRGAAGIKQQVKPRDFIPTFIAARRKQTMTEMKKIPELFRRR